jgi:hypothetical protein
MIANIVILAEYRKLYSAKSGIERDFFEKGDSV